MSGVATLRELVGAMEKIAPTAHAESWDNVGLIAGDIDQPMTRVMLTIDYTAAVSAEVAQKNCDAVIAYHPPIFKPVSRLTAPHLVFDAIRRGIGIYSPHTALDVAEGGTNDCLAESIGLKNCAPIQAIGSTEQLKLATFVPAEHVEAVSSALFAAGAGRIGQYSSCSFRSPGTGTFFGQAGTNPAVGKAGRLEEQPEIRLETVVPTGGVSAVVAALRKSHPYEEPAFDLVRLAAAPNGVGMGRIGLLGEPAERGELIERVKRAVGVLHVLAAGPMSGVVKKAAVCAGSCGSVLDAAIAMGAEAFVTGELRHHDALKAAAAGVTAICTLHSNSERMTLGRLRERLAKELSAVGFVLSEADRDPL
ncbi:MAG TPA: Nif3-like dinuclear metal center hexameric protein, partial [Tepidisphaeraceae bacterium]|nr:Nif3-like dinuclear metal center hexameric protein [Tepidisphaeraceae bacterium]